MGLISFYLLFVNKGKKIQNAFKTRRVKKAGKTNTDRTEKEVKLGNASKNVYSIINSLDVTGRSSVLRFDAV